MSEQIETETILLIEDDASIAELMQEKLNGQGKNVAYVAAGRDALKWLEKSC